MKVISTLHIYIFISFHYQPDI